MALLLAGCCRETVLVAAPANEAVKAVAESVIKLKGRLDKEGSWPELSLTAGQRASGSDSSCGASRRCSDAGTAFGIAGNGAGGASSGRCSNPGLDIAIPRAADAAEPGSAACGGAQPAVDPCVAPGVPLGDMVMVLVAKHTAGLSATLEKLCLGSRCRRLFDALNPQNGFQASVEELQALLQNVKSTVQDVYKAVGQVRVSR